MPSTPGGSPAREEHQWQNDQGHTVAVLRILGDQPGGFRVWIEGPRQGWLYCHLEMPGRGEFICRAACQPNDFLGEMVAALRGIVTTEESTVATAHAEPHGFEFRFVRPAGPKDVRFELVGFPRFDNRTPETTDPVLGIAPSGDGVCREFCRGLRLYQEKVSAEAYQTGMGIPFPTAELAELGTLLGGEFAPQEK
jgi:hypothetical protein